MRVAALRQLARTDVTVVSMQPRCLHDVWDDVRQVGAERRAVLS